MIQDIGNIATQANFADVYATADIYTDFFAAIPAFYYETHGVLLHFECGFGCGSQTLVKNEMSAMDKVDKSNVFMSSTKEFLPNKSFLFDNSIKKFQPALKKQAMKRLLLMGVYKIDNVFYQIYVKPVS